MLKSNILDVLVNQPFPNKCQILNSILEECTTKDLYTSFETIVNCLFKSQSLKLDNSFNLSDINNNRSKNLEPKLNWPLNLVNRSKYGFEYDCMFGFLNTNSLFWFSIFKLDNLNAPFSLETSSLPANLKFRIENGLSILSSKLDTFNVLNLSALEYYLIHFLLQLHDTKQTSRRLYNEQYGNIELDSVYADLLNDYLNYFLPVNDRDVNFPNFADFNQTKQSISSLSPIPTHRHHSSLLKRVVQKSLTEDDLSVLSESDRIGDMKKIDLFLRLVVEILVSSFTDPIDQSISNPKQMTIDGQLNRSMMGLSKMNKTPTKSGPFGSSYNKNLFLSNSPVKLNDPKQYLASVDIIFALSMILKHCHIFSNVFQVNYQLSQNPEWNKIYENPVYNKKPTRFASNKNESPIDELRIILFKVYLRKPFLKFFQFHLEHWPLNPSIKWIIELWSTYIQPWKFVQMTNKNSSEFVKENLFLFVDVYQLIIKRYCIFDLTNEENLRTLHSIFCIFYNQSQLINKYDNIFSNVQSNSASLTQQELDFVLRQNADYKFVVNLFNDSDKQLFSYKSLNGPDNLKLITSFYESIQNAKNIINNQIALKMAPKGNIFYSVFKSLFSDDQDKEFSNMSIDDLKRIIGLIDECVSLLQEFYKLHSSFVDNYELFTPKETTKIEKTRSTLKPNAECEISKNGLTLKLSPRGRYQIINRLCKPNIANYYDPDTAPIGEFENKLLVYLFKQISDLINQKYSADFERLYFRDDLVGRISRKYLYGPNDLKNKICSIDSNRLDSRQTNNEPPPAPPTTTIYQSLNRELINDSPNSPNLNKVRLSLRSIANYKFIFYFFIYFIMIRSFTNFSFLFIFLIVCSIFLVYSLFKSES